MKKIILFLFLLFPLILFSQIFDIEETSINKIIAYSPNYKIIEHTEKKGSFVWYVKEDTIEVDSLIKYRYNIYFKSNVISNNHILPVFIQDINIDILEFNNITFVNKNNKYIDYVYCDFKDKLVFSYISRFRCKFSIDYKNISIK